MSKKISFKEFCNKCNELFDNRYYYLECSFVQMRDYIWMYDKQKDIFIKQIASRHYQGERPRASLAMTFKEFEEEMKKFFKGRFIFFEESFTSATKSNVRFSDKEGNQYEYSAKYLLKGRLPPELNPKAKNKKAHNSYDTDKVKELIAKSNPYIDHLDLSLIDYKGYYEEFYIRCTIHDYIFSSTLERAKRNNCPICARKIAMTNCRKGNQYYLDKFKEVHNAKYTYEEQEIYSEGDVWAVCPVHEYRFKVNVNRHLLSVGCPKCSSARTTSKKEKELLEWLKKLLPDTTIKENYKPKWLTFDSGRVKELDIFIPYLSLAIEYNGIYYHSVEFDSKFLDYHQKKYEICKGNNVNLIHIFEFENLEKWKKKLANYFLDSNKYCINYKHNKRKNFGYTCYGQSYIKRTY